MPILSSATNGDDFDFNERFTKLKAAIDAQLKVEARVNALIAMNLGKVKMA